MLPWGVAFLGWVQVNVLWIVVVIVAVVVSLCTDKMMERSQRRRGAEASELSRASEPPPIRRRHPPVLWRRPERVERHVPGTSEGEVADRYLRDVLR